MNLVWMLVLAQAAASDGDAEAYRLSNEIAALAAKSQWGGVERAFVALGATGVAPDDQVLIHAASAAEGSGDLALCRARLLAAKDAGGDPGLIDPWIRRIDEGYAHLVLIADGRSLIAEATPFSTADQQAVARASEVLEATGRFDGFLPPGRYLVGGAWIELSAGQRVELDWSGDRRRRSLKEVLGLQPAAPPQ